MDSKTKLHRKARKWNADLGGLNQKVAGADFTTQAQSSRHFLH